jgi:hypothetical protein
MAKKEDKTLAISERVKVPSHFDMVTPKNIKRFCEVIKELPREFEAKDVAEAVDSWTNLAAIGRLLSYVKYLNIVNEKRVLREDRRTQIFNLTPMGERIKKSFMFEPHEFPGIWTDVVRNSGVYQSLLNGQDIKEYGRISMASLEKTVYEAHGGRSENVAKRGARFVSNLLQDAGLAEVDGNMLSFKLETEEEKEESQEEETHEKLGAKTLPHIVQEGHEHILSPGNFEIDINLTKRSVDILKAYVETWTKILGPEENDSDETEDLMQETEDQ